eukprot:7309177-Ditylum_brightwellii.AAC.1
MNNESVITRIHKQKGYQYDYSFHTLKLNWDVIAQIVATLKKQTFNDTFAHVKGNQDKDKKYNELLLPARLNIDVDALAVEFCCEYTKSTTRVIHLPINAAQLNIDNMTISRKYFPTVQDCAARQSSLNHIQQQKNWTSGQSQLVVWEAFCIV